VGLLCGAEDRCIIGLLGAPNGMDQAYPLIGQRAQRYAMALPLTALALVLVQRPSLFGDR
jgi:hypothetical protein